MILVALTEVSSNLSDQFRRLVAQLPALVQPQTTVAAESTERQVQRRLTAKQVEQQVTSYQAGASVKELAAEWQLHRTTVAAQLRRAGVQLRRQGVSADQLPEAHPTVWPRLVMPTLGRALRLRR